jgi:hypothetical protein
MTTHIDTAKNIITEIREMTTPFNGISLENTPQEIKFAFSNAKISSRESYLAWVARYKSLINRAGETQRCLRQEIRSKEYPDSEQTSRSHNANYITRLIEVRRASKIAARESRNQELQAA